jgi:low temperature requirement protein LtrA
LLEVDDLDLPFAYSTEQPTVRLLLSSQADATCATSSLPVRIPSTGECVTGAVAMVNATAQTDGSGFTPVLIGTACVGLTFGCWWIYFATPFGEALQNRREGAFGWGYVHLLIFPSIVAMGAGLQVAAQFVARQSALSATAALAVTAISLGIYISCVFLVNYLSSLHWRWLYSVLWGGGAVIVAAALAIANMGVPFALCLGLLATAPFVVIVGHELSGYPFSNRLG